MPESGSLISISDAQADAIKKAIEALQGVGGFLREILGTVPEDLVGYFGGDWLKVRRAENAARIIQLAKERLEARNARPERPSVSVALPLLIAAADEDRDELQELWARLLAAAMDPAREKSFRLAFVEVVKKMDPLDAKVLQRADNINSSISNNVRSRLANDLSRSADQINISIDNLTKLELLANPYGPNNNAGERVVTPFGREFLRAIGD